MEIDATFEVDDDGDSELPSTYNTPLEFEAGSQNENQPPFEDEIFVFVDDEDAHTIGPRGKTRWQQRRSALHPPHNIAYPFRDIAEAELCEWFVSNNISKTAIDELLSLEYVSVGQG